jgi:hypothetical protein
MSGFLVLCIVLSIMCWVATTGLLRECERTAYGPLDQAVIIFMYAARVLASVMIIAVGFVN